MEPERDFFKKQRFSHALEQIKSQDINRSHSKRLSNKGFSKSKLICEEEIDFERESELLGEDLILTKVKSAVKKNSVDSEPFPSTRNANESIQFIKTTGGKTKITIDRSQRTKFEVTPIKYDFSVYIRNLPRVMSERKLR